MNSSDVINLQVRGPPSSPPATLARLRYSSVLTHTTAKMVKRVTEKARFPGSTMNGFPLERQATAAMVHATPIPRKTLTALEPVTLPMEASAYWSWMAATLLAKVSEENRKRVDEVLIFFVSNNKNKENKQ